VYKSTHFTLFLHEDCVVTIYIVSPFKLLVG